MLRAQDTWRRCYGGGGSDQAVAIRACADGGFAVLGTTGSFGSGASDLYLLRIDASGAPLWSRLYGGEGAESAAGLIALEDGFLVCGTTADGPLGGYDAWAVRTDASGAPVWERHYGGADWDLCAGAVAVGDGFLLVGQTFSGNHAQGAGFAFRLDHNGDVLWEHAAPLAGATAYSAALALPGGRVAICGAAATAAEEDQGLLTVLNNDGGTAWSITHGGAGSDRFNGLTERPEGGILAIGATRSGAPVQRILLSAFDATGALDWERYYGNTADAGGTDICQAHGGGFALTGYNTLNAGNRDMIFTLADNDGWFQTGNNFGDGRPADGRSIIADPSGGYAIAGWIEEAGPGPRSMYVVRTNGNGQTATLTVACFSDPVEVREQASPALLRLSPNPAPVGSSVRLEGDRSSIQRVDLMDARGRAIGSAPLRVADDRIVLPASAIGTFFLVFHLRDGRAFAQPLTIIQD